MGDQYTGAGDLSAPGVEATLQEITPYRTVTGRSGIRQSLTSIPFLMHIGQLRFWIPRFE